MPPTLMRELALRAHGLKLVATALPTVALDASGRHLLLGPDNLKALSELSSADAQALAAWRAQVKRFARALHPLLSEPPPRLGTDQWHDRAALLRIGWRIRRLGRGDMRELLRIGGMCVHDLLEERFTQSLLKGALALDAVLGTNYGPRSPGTVLSLLYRAAASQGGDTLALPEGGLGAVAQALASAARAAGAEIRSSTPVRHIAVRDDRAAGVVLESGEEITAGSVVSSADPKTTFLRLLGSEHLDAGFVRRVAQLRSRGLAAKVHLALERLPAFSGLARRGLTTAGCWWHRPRTTSSVPTTTPSTTNFRKRRCSRSRFRPSRTRLWHRRASTSCRSSCSMRPTLSRAAGTGSVRRSASGSSIYCPRYAPRLRQSVSAQELLTPPDIEREFRISGGHWHHAELALDQLLMVRPVPGQPSTRRRVPGLFLCGAGSHPGGGVMGLAGRNAARRILRAA